ncbi:DUF4276 family protein [Geminocystis sp.]|uniref:DUF4276 family protein n=1 Tax=Geminocystis sp. TaxID=2664100 RepID=UPI003593B312
MSYDIIFLLEEPSMKEVLEKILPQLIPSHKTFLCIPHQGKQDLAQSIPRKLKAFQYFDTKFVIVHDQDSHDCKTLKAELLKICQQAGNSKVLIRIICHELESWFLGDLAAVEKGLERKPGSLTRHQNQTKFRNPDRLNSAKQELKQLLGEYYSLRDSKKIAPHLSLSSNCSHSYQVFIKSIEKICK